MASRPCPYDDDFVICNDCGTQDHVKDVNWPSNSVDCRNKFFAEPRLKTSISGCTLPYLEPALLEQQVHVGSSVENGGVPKSLAELRGQSRLHRITQSPARDRSNPYELYNEEEFVHIFRFTKESTLALAEILLPALQHGTDRGSGIALRHCR